MDKNGDEKRIPTIDESAPWKDDEEIRIAKVDVSLVVKRIERARDLHSELKPLPVDIQGLSELIAWNLYLKTRHKKSLILKNRTEDNREKTEKRWKDSKEPEGQRKALTRVIVKEKFARHEAGRFRHETKAVPFISEFISDLLYVLKEVKHPYRYIAAVFNIFNFHSENACGKCDRFDAKKDWCRKIKIFDCPIHDKVRKNLHIRAERASQDPQGEIYPIVSP